MIRQQEDLILQLNVNISRFTFVFLLKLYKRSLGLMNLNGSVMAINTGNGTLDLLFEVETFRPLT